MSSPSHTGDRLEHLDTLGEPTSRGHLVDDDRLRQEFFVDWEVPLTPAASDSDYAGRPGLPVDLRGTGALLVGDFDALAR